MVKTAPRKPTTRSQRRHRAATPSGAAAASFSALANAAILRGEPDALPDESLHAVFAAALRVYVAKVERRGTAVMPFAHDAVTATEAIIAACGIVRAADLNPFDMAMWFHRLPTN